MKILLLNPPLIPSNHAGELIGLNDGDNAQVSLGLYSLAAVLLRDGHAVKLLNHALTPWMRSIQEAESFEPDLVGIACMTHHRAAVEKWAADFKARRPQCRIVLGGAHASFLYAPILERWPAVDFVAVGEAETSLSELARRLSAGENPALIPGIASRGADGSIAWAGPAAPIEDLGSLPIPARHFAYDIVSTARGCPFACSFCCSPGMWSRRVRERPVAHVIEELELLRAQHKFTQVHFKDETFTLRAERVRELCGGMIDAGLNLWWTCDTRVDCLDEERLSWMRKAGCFYISIGVESGSERMLARIDKRISREKVKAATALARRFGMHVRYYLIVGLPGEEEADLKASLEMVKTNQPHFVFVSPLSLSPGTPVFREYCKERQVDDALWFATDERSLPYDPAAKWRRTASGRALEALNNVGRGSRARAPHYPFTEAELREAAERMPDSFAPQYDLALFLREQGRLAEAVPFYRRALEIWPEFGKGWLDLGVCLDQMGEMVSAVEQWEKVESIREEADENVLLAWIYRGLAALAQGEIEEALMLWERAHHHQPRAIDPLRLIAEKSAQNGRWDEAAWASELWAKLAPASGQALHISALACMAQDQFDDARDLFERAIGLEPENADIYNNYAVMLARLGEVATAIPLLQTCLSLNPNHWAARRLLDKIRARSRK